MAPRSEILGYRHASLVAVCAICQNEAIARCPRCGRPLCTLHAVDSASRCYQCEDSFESTRHRVNIATVGVVGALLAGVIGLASAALLPLGTATAVVGIGAIPAAALVRALLGGAARRRFLAEGDGSPMLENAELTIAPQPGPEAATRLRRGRWAHKPRGETPTPPIWARTYGR